MMGSVGPCDYCRPLFFVDGVYAGNASDTDLVTVISVEHVEVYSGAARIPARFTTIGAAENAGTSCGVIAFWTRR